MGRLAFATTNKHKVAELNSVLRTCGVEVEPINIPKVELQSDSLEVIASYAAVHAWSIVRRPVIVEDAGLFIEALGGFPGPYSSYVYRTIGIAGVLKLMEGIGDRRAYFKSDIALAYDGGLKVFTGIVRGIIAYQAKGSGGFGFDPIFIPEGSTRTFAEMSLDEKNKFSHRGRAARKLCEWLTLNRKGLGL